MAGWWSANPTVYRRAGSRRCARPSARIRGAIAEAGGWLPFDRFMALALYAPGLGYYARGQRIFGTLPQDGSDFVTAPEMSPLFAQALAVQLRQALEATQTDELWEFGAGSGVLAAQLIEALGRRCAATTWWISRGRLQARQRAAGALGERVVWHAALPERLDGVIVGNEVLDALPVQLLHWDGRQWHERGVACVERGAETAFAWADRPTALRPPVDPAGHPGFVPGTVIEIHPQAEALVRTLAQALSRGAMFFIDYGFP
jgi:SAM-dependent MidA family methyltransferase